MANVLAKRKDWFIKLINFWPPFAAAGISVSRITPDLRELDVQLKMRPWNKNYVGTHFGGSMFSMVDPWYMIMLLNNVGRDYVVWDKAGTIRFRNPGVGTITAKFKLTEEVIAQIKEEADRVGRAQPVFHIEIFDASEKLVAEVDKTISVRRKDQIKSRVKASESGDQLVKEKNG